MRASALALSAALWATLLAALAAPMPAAASFNDLPDIARRQALAMVEACTMARGTPTDPMTAIERVDLDGDGVPDVIVDENRFDCRGRPSMHCDPIGCRTTVFLSNRGRWRLSFDVIGSYCIEHDRTPPRFVTIQRNFLADGSQGILNARYRFERGLYFPDGRGRC